MTIKAVIFDVGGVLIMSFARQDRAWEARLNLPERGLWMLIFKSDVEKQAVVGAIKQHEAWQQFAVMLNIDEAVLAQLREDFWATEYLNQELVQFARTLRPRYKTALLSNAWSEARPEN
jgi:putative hydrolase of the HAD superfamily